jgi:hypothetical protein
MMDSEYKPEHDGAYRFVITSPTYAEASKIAEIMGMGIRKWNWCPGDESSVKDKRPWEGVYHEA